MRITIAFLMVSGLSSCNTTQISADNNVLSLNAFHRTCNWENEDRLACEKLHRQQIQFVGNMYYPKPKWTAAIYPKGTSIPVHDDDVLWDEMPDSLSDKRVHLKVPEGKQKKMLQFHRKTVHVNGTINTDCVKAGREAGEKMERLNNNNNQDDDVIIMLTGFCHSHGEFIENIKINEIQ